MLVDTDKQKKGVGSEYILRRLIDINDGYMWTKGEMIW